VFGLLSKHNCLARTREEESDFAPQQARIFRALLRIQVARKHISLHLNTHVLLQERKVFTFSGAKRFFFDRAAIIT
jgi:hypothetical protein